MTFACIFTHSTKMKFTDFTARSWCTVTIINLFICKIIRKKKYFVDKLDSVSPWVITVQLVWHISSLIKGCRIDCRIWQLSRTDLELNGTEGMGKILDNR